jgi:hypothetical protein
MRFCIGHCVCGPGAHNALRVYYSLLTIERQLQKFFLIPGADVFSMRPDSSLDNCPFLKVNRCKNSERKHPRAGRDRADTRQKQHAAAFVRFKLL